MIEVYKPLNTLNNPEDKLKIFLAGGIDKAPDWQKEAENYFIEKYSNFPIALFNPRAETKFEKEDHVTHEKQVKWEFDHLIKADAILFWFPENAPCTTSLFELGFWVLSGKTFIGINPGHYKEKSLKTQIKLINDFRYPINQITINSSLEDTINNTILSLLIYKK